MDQTPPPPKPLPLIGIPPLPLIVAGAFFMEQLDGTVVVTALPKIGASFNVTVESLGLAITAYMVTLAAVVPTSGWIAERFGARTIFTWAIALFVVASVMCGLSTGLWMFIASRVLQGAAAALMSPVGRLVVIRTTEKKDLIPAIAAITWPALIAPVLGPPLGGLIATYASWRWIFFLNVPLGIAGVLLALRYTPNHRSEERHRFDTLGFVLTAIALGGLIYGLDLVGQRHGRGGGGFALGLALAVGAILVGVAAVWHARRTDKPMLDLRSLAHASFRQSVATSGMATRIAISSTPFLIPLVFQLGFGFNAFQAGLMVLVYMVGNLVMKVFTTQILRWFAFRPVLIASNLVTVAMLTACAMFTPATPQPVMWAVLLIAGMSRSMGFTATNTLTFADVTPQERAGATALSAMLQQMSVSLGVALAALSLNVSLSLLKEPMLGLIDFRIAFLGMAAMALLAALGFLKLPRDAGHEVRGVKDAPKAKA